MSNKSGFPDTSAIVSIISFKEIPSSFSSIMSSLGPSTGSKKINDIFFSLSLNRGRILLRSFSGSELFSSSIQAAAYI